MTVNRIAVTCIVPKRLEIRCLDGIDKDDFDFVEQISAGTLLALFSSLLYIFFFKYDTFFIYFYIELMIKYEI